MPGPSDRIVRIPFVSNKHAMIAKQVIDVDAELQKEAVKRTLTVEGDELIASVYVPLLRLALLTVGASQDIPDVNHPFSASINQWILGER